METGQFDKIMVYCQKVSYTADWGFLLTHMVRANPAGALEFAQKLQQAPDVTLDINVVTDVFMQHNCLQQATSFLLDVLKGNKAEEGPLQTRLLEMNLMAAPQVADAIMANDMFTQYDKPRIGMLCEKAGLMQRAIEHYESLDDLKRVMSRTELIQPEFLVKFFGTQSCETSMECLHHLLRTNMRQNLQVVVQVAREYSEQLTCEKLIEMFESYNSWEGLFYFLGAVLLKTEDKDVHFKYIEAAAKVGNLQEVERVTREDEHFDPKRVARLPQGGAPARPAAAHQRVRPLRHGRGPHALPLLEQHVQVHRALRAKGQPDEGALRRGRAARRRLLRGLRARAHPLGARDGARRAARRGGGEAQPAQAAAAVARGAQSTRACRRRRCTTRS